jgi:hypothetical protein
MPAIIFLDDLVQTLYFLGRPQLLKFLLINRLFFELIEKHFSTRPFLNTILRIWTEQQETEGGEVEHDHHHNHIYFGIAHLEMNDSNKYMWEREEEKQHLLNRKVTRKWQWWIDKDYETLWLDEANQVRNKR